MALPPFSEYRRLKFIWELMRVMPETRSARKAMKDGPSLPAQPLNSNDWRRTACGPHDMTSISRVLGSFLYPEGKEEVDWN